jgi:hypothetical protein
VSFMLHALSRSGHFNQFKSFEKPWFVVVQVQNFEVVFIASKNIRCHATLKGMFIS